MFNAMGTSGTDAAHFNGADLSHVVSELIKSVQDLKGQVAAHDELLSKMNRLEAENNDLRANMGKQNQEILRLRGLLSAADHAASSSNFGTAFAGPTETTGPPGQQKSRDFPVTKDTPYIHPKKTNFRSRDFFNLNSDPALDGLPDLSWVDVTRQYRPASRPLPSARKIASAARAFSQPDPSAATGFQYVYLPRKRKFSRSEIRSNLRRLGVDPSRILDISFPARSCVALLVHQQYISDLLKLLQSAKVAPLDNFDPLDPVHLADPKYADDAESLRATKMSELQSDRCVGVLKYIRPHLVLAVGNMFIAEGWIVAEDLKAALDAAFPRGSPGKRPRFFFDEHMKDASDSSDDDSYEEKHLQ